MNRTKLPVDDPRVAEVTAVVHEPAGASGHAVLLAPGAGGDLDGVGLVALAEVLAEQGHLVVRSNLPNHEVRRPAPRAERSVPAFASLLEQVRERIEPGRRWIAGGKSYGGRVASLAVAGGVEVVGLLLYGYPLHPPGKPERLRVDHWPAVSAPTLFLQGTRDPLCDLDLLRESVRLLPRPATLEIVEGGDHSLDVSAKASPDGIRHRAPDVLRRLAPAIQAWVADTSA